MSPPRWDREGAYTTVLKLLQIMTDKELVRRDESSRTHIYEAAHTEAHTQQHLIADLLDRAFDGSAAKLVMSALSERKRRRRSWPRSGSCSSRSREVRNERLDARRRLGHRSLHLARNAVWRSLPRWRSDLCRRQSSSVRYAIACTALAAMLAGVIVTALVIRSTGEWRYRADARVDAHGRRRPGRRVAADSYEQTAQPSTVRSNAQRVEALLPWIVSTWLTRCAVLFARSAAGLVARSSAAPAGVVFDALEPGSAPPRALLAESD